LFLPFSSFLFLLFLPPFSFYWHSFNYSLHSFINFRIYSVISCISPVIPHSSSVVSCTLSDVIPSFLSLLPSL
jgi:hypothetical protein